MKTFFKGIITVGALAGLGYLGFKGYKRLNGMMKLSKTLPEFLFDLLDEKPKINISQKLNTLSITVGLSAEGYENLKIDLEEQIGNYVADYYPDLAKLRLIITKYIKTTESETEDNEEDEDTCGCGCGCDNEE